MSSKVYKAVGMQIASAWIPFETASEDPGLMEAIRGNAGSYNPRIAMAAEVKPVIRATTHALASVLANIGLGGTALTNGLIIYAQLDGAGYASGSVHKQIKTHLGLSIIERIGARGAEPVASDILIYGCSDGTNDAFEFSDVAFPSVTHLSDLWFLGPFSNGEALIELASAEYTPGLQVWHNTHTGQLQPTRAHVLEGQPKLTLETHDMSLIAGLGIAGAPFEDAIQYFRHGSETTGRDADGAGSHVSLTFAKAFAKAGQGSGAWNQAANTQIVVSPVQDGANAVAAVSTTASIVDPAA